MITIMSQPIFETIAAMAGEPRRLDAGEKLFHQGDPVRSLFLVSSGAVRLVRYGAAGDAVVLQQARAGEIVAEASVFTAEYHCGAECLSEVAAHAVPVVRFRDQLRSDPAFAEQWMIYLARSVQTARARAEILAARTVDERLARWRAWFGELPGKGRRKDLAGEIGVTPEALYRALARRNRDG